MNKWKTVDPFIDQINLGAKASLPRTFEKATSVAKLVPANQIDSINFDQLLYEAVERLGEIYLAQIESRDISLGDQVAEEIVSISKPLKKRSGRQGFSLSAPQRKAVELRAMHLATEYLVKAGYSCSDTSATQSFDILAELGGEQLKVEVKGTTSDFCDSVVMTRNEVDLHRAEKGKTGLVIVSKISLDKDKESPSATGGVLEVMLNWDIDEWTTDPIAYQVSKGKR